MRKLTTNQFISKAIQRHGKTYNYSRSIYNGWKEKVEIVCTKHGSFKQSALDHVHGAGCPACKRERLSRIKMHSLKDFIRDATIVFGSCYDYSKVDYRGNNQKVEIICPKHGSFFKTPNAHIGSKQGCPACSRSISSGERLIKKWLEQKNIVFNREYIFKECINSSGRYLRFDFYIPSLNLCIEYDGKQHFIELPGSKFEPLAVIQSRDLIKTLYCINNGIRLIRISYKEKDNIEDILQKEIYNG